MAKPALLSTGPMMSLIDEGIDKSFTVHRLHQAGDRDALLKRWAPTSAPSAPAATPA